MTKTEQEKFIEKLNPIATTIGDLGLSYRLSASWFEPNGDRVFEFTASSGTAPTLLLTIKNDKDNE